MKPSPRPWSIMQTNATWVEIVCDADNHDIFRVDGLDTLFTQDAANAAHIVRCVNLHDELVTRLEAMCDLAELQGGFDDEDGMRSIARSRKTLEKARKADAD